LKTLNLKNPLCFFDLETTGINITNDRIIEIAVIKMLPGGELIRKSNVLNPTIPIPAESSAIHGLKDEDVREKPTFKEVAKDYARFFEGADLAGFNILKFDIPVLVEEFLRAGVDFDYSRKKIVDAQKIFHLMEKRTLGAAYRFYLNKEIQNSHTAEADTEATMEVLLAQVEKYENQDVTDGLNKKIGVLNDKGLEVFNFGKHKNKSVTEVLKQEPSYYEWMMNGDFPLDTKRKLTEIKLRGFKK
jgi:DNA polymerase III subunit epsilon